MNLITILVMALFLGLGGCNQDLEFRQSKLAIVGGQPAAAAAYPAIALLRPDSQGTTYVYCTGVLIASRFVLTAAHCSQDSHGTPHPLNSLQVMAGIDEPEAHLDQAVAVKHLVIHPQYDSNKMAMDADSGLRLHDANDLAIWELASPITTLAPAQILDPQAVDGVLTKQRTLTIAGFGVQSPWESPWNKRTFAVAETPFQTFYQQTVKIVAAAAPRGAQPGSGVQHLSLPARSATEFYAGGLGLPDTCKGDSGGPIFVKLDSGALLLIGITSRGSSTCDQGGIYTLVPAFLPWLVATAGPVNTSVVKNTAASHLFIRE